MRLMAADLGPGVRPDWSDDGTTSRSLSGACVAEVDVFSGGPMSEFPYRRALIVGTGPGISASIARRLTELGVKVAVAARDIGKLESLVDEIGGAPFAVGASDASAVASLFEQIEEKQGAPDLVVFNASGRARGSLIRPPSRRRSRHPHSVAFSSPNGLHDA
jgi:short chain dehydrogenase